MNLDQILKWVRNFQNIGSAAEHQRRRKWNESVIVRSCHYKQKKKTVGTIIIIYTNFLTFNSQTFGVKTSSKDSVKSESQWMLDLWSAINDRSLDYKNVRLNKQLM